MAERLVFTEDERQEAHRIFEVLRTAIAETIKEKDEEKITGYIDRALEQGILSRDVFGLNPVLTALRTAQIAVEETGVRRDAVLATLLFTVCDDSEEVTKQVKADFGDQVAGIVHGLRKVHELYSKTPVIETENFRNLLLSFAEDMRVILIMIADRVCVMRQIRDVENKEAQHKVAEEASYLYAPLAHKLGLYRLKSELEDLSLKYLEHDAYYMIKNNLNATKKTRDAYIENFIGPIQKKLEAVGLKFHMKGRTKSIHSIWQKMNKQKCGFNGIYDLFAIRIIIDAPFELEKMQCWQVYSIITDMYQPNPKRLRDWLSVPKSNGYESLHITVLGPENKWVEVQIRTERMDEIAERGLAAHWRYKGVKSSEGGMDAWLTSIREALENSAPNVEAGRGLMDQFKMDLYEKEIYVFTPKGDLYKLANGATVLDFAYHIHSGVGNKCVGARINGRNVNMRETLHSGDQVEILTQSTQKPKQDWLNIVQTSRAKSKIRQALKEFQVKEASFARELIERRLKNRKVEFDENTMHLVIKKLNYKVVSDFYKDIATEKLDIAHIIEMYIEANSSLHSPLSTLHSPQHSAEEFKYDASEKHTGEGSDDVLVIDKNLKGVDFSLAKCCSPIYGDDVFGFVTVNGGIKIHRATCPNAAELYRRFGYRIVKARWSGKGESQYSITIRVIGNDDLGIVNNITSLISKEEKITMRSINIDSNDGLFSGNIQVMIDDKGRVEQLMKKLRTIKGVRQVTRI